MTSIFVCFYEFSLATAVSEVPATEVPQTGTQVNIRTLTLCVFLSAGAVVAVLLLSSSLDDDDHDDEA